LKVVSELRNNPSDSQSVGAWDQFLER